MKKTAENYQIKPTPKRWPSILLVSILVFLLIAVIASILVRRTYINYLKPRSNDKTVHLVTIPIGSTAGEIADILKSNGVIRSDWAFEWYVRTHEMRAKLQAGTYALAPSQSVAEIASIIAEGKIDTHLVTILPGQKLAQIRDSLITKYGFKDTAVDGALNPALYANHLALTDKPAGASLEGYLYPESFQKTAATTPEQIIRLSLDEMVKRLTPERRAAFSSRGLSVHQAITMASIVEQEVSKPEDRAQVAQVFYSRLREGMRLESDPTVKYGDPAYNTYEIKSLPPGPISNVSESSLQAVAHPSDTDWLYFVSDDEGDDKGVTYFSRTLQEHTDLIRKHCTKLCHQ